jgi:hypothetical protein
VPVARYGNTICALRNNDNEYDNEYDDNEYDNNLFARI